MPVNFINEFVEDALVLPDSVQEASRSIWHDYVVGFFLDEPLSFTVVVQHLKRVWRLKGSIKVKSDGVVFMFLFSCEDDRRMIIQADPIIMRNKLFIVKQWDPTVSNICGSVTSVPIWIHIYNIPLAAWSPLGINWLAGRIGCVKCLDESTERMERLTYAKALVEVTPIIDLVDSFQVLCKDGTKQTVFVDYQWRPQACKTCKVFGHDISSCKNSVKSDEVIKKNSNTVLRQIPKIDTMVKDQNDKIMRNKSTSAWKRVDHGSKGKSVLLKSKEDSGSDKNGSDRENETRKKGNVTDNNKDIVFDLVEEGEVVEELVMNIGNKFQVLQNLNEVNRDVSIEESGDKNNFE